MTPKQRAILATVPVGQRANAESYFAALENYEKEWSEFKHAQDKLYHAKRQLSRVGDLFQPPVMPGHGAAHYPKGVLYRGLRTGRYYEGIGADWRAMGLKADGRNGARTKMWVSEPVIELAPDDPFREKRKVAAICNRLEGKHE